MIPIQHRRYLNSFIPLLGVFTLLLMLSRLKLKFLFVEIDYTKVFINPDYSKLDKSRHFTNLLSNFSCHSEHIRIVIMVTSHPSSTERRESIRMTWGKRLHEHTDNEFRTFYVVGRVDDRHVMESLATESNIHKDLVIYNVTETFHNLPYKVEAGFEWAYKHCSFDYLIKGDDDVFVNLYQVVDLVGRETTPSTRLYLGKCHYMADVSRHGKYSVTFDEYRKPHYPDYCAGGAAIISYDVIQGVIPYILQKPFKIDDVYIGTLIKNYGVAPIEEKRFRLDMKTCRFYNDTIAHHSAYDWRCMQSMYFDMLVANVNNGFIRRHYIDYFH